MDTVIDPIASEAAAAPFAGDVPADRGYENGGRSLDRLCRLVGRILRVPVTLMTVIGDDRQHFAGAYGLPKPWSEDRETPLSHSFCRHVVAAGGPLLISDARVHPTLAGNPAIEALGVVAYCGVPVVSPEGTTIGVMCAIDHQPRQWARDEVELVTEFAALVVEVFAAREEADRHVQVLQELRATETKFKTFMDHSPAVAYIKDEDGRFAYVNGTMLQYYPEAGGWVGQLTEEVFPPAVAADLRAADRAAVATDRGVEREEFIPAQDGTPNHWLSFKFPLRTPDGRTLLGCMAVNIDERKRAEADRDARDLRLRLCLQAGHLGTYTYDHRSGTVAVDEQMCLIHGWDPAVDAVPVGAFKDQIHPDDWARMRPVISRFDAREGDVAAEYRIVLADGSVRWVATVARPHGSHETLGVHSDVTDRRTAEEELRAAKGAAETLAVRSDAANQAKSQFLSNISHEIRTPLTAIFGYADLLLIPGQSPAEHLDYVQTIRRNGEHLLSIINDVLDLSKIEADRMDVERIPVSLPQVLSDVMSLMRQRAAAKLLGFRVVQATTIPERIDTDPTRLRQVLINLVGNALKFTERGSVEIRVGIDDAAAGGPALRVAVVDTGIGMSGAQEAALFAAFSQVDPTHARRFGGTGLGLSISRRLARLLGGDLTYAANPAGGSVFTLTVPAGDLTGVPRVSDVADVVTAPRPTGFEPGSTALSGRILLADDSPDNQRLIAFYLTSSGATVELVGDGRAAVERGAASVRAGRPYDLVLMDIQMPELDGYGATSALRSLGFTNPIVALTANAMDHERARCLQCGCDGFLTKPIQVDTLLRGVAGFLRQTAKGANAPAAVSATVVVAEPAAAGGALFSEMASNPVFAPLLGVFLQELEGKVATIERAMSVNNVAGARRTVHQIRGSGGSYGYQPISDAAEVAEAALADPIQTGESAGPAVARLVALCRRALAGGAVTAAAESARPTAETAPQLTHR